jgi:hypothetical protein
MNLKDGKYVQKPNLKCAHPKCNNILGLEQSRSAIYCSQSCASRNRIVWNKGLHDKNTKYAYKRCKKKICANGVVLFQKIHVNWMLTIRMGNIKIIQKIIYKHYVPIVIG